MKKTLLLLTALILPVAAMAQVDQFGKLDTLYAELAKIDNTNWSITLNYSNDESVAGMSVALKLSAANNRIVADSAVYAGGRVEHWNFKGFRPDTAIQCVTLGMIANLGPTHHTLTVGQGRLVTIFVSSLDNKAIEKLAVDTTTTQPNNTLMVVADRVQEGMDTIPIHDRQRLEIRPAFVVVEPK